MGILARVGDSVVRVGVWLAKAKDDKLPSPAGSSYWVAGAPSIGGLWGNGFWGGDTTPGSWQKGETGSVTPSMLTFSAVYACVSIISGDMAKLDLDVLRRDPKGGYDDAKSHWLYRIIKKPNSYQTRMDFIQAWMVSTLLAGNAFILVEFDGAQRPTAWHVLDPRRVSVLVTDEGDVWYQIQPQPLAGVSNEEGAITIPARFVIHHRLMTLAHPLIGVTPLFASASSAIMGANILANSKAFFNNMSRPSGMLTAPGKISKETAERLQKHWQEQYSGSKLGQIAVGGDGLEFKPLTMSAIDMQLIDQLRYSVEDVARCFRVPGFLLGNDQKVTYKNSETLSRAYYSGCLQYHMEAIEDRIDTFFELPDDIKVEFDLDDLLRTDMDVRYSSYATGLNSGFLTINETRARENLPNVKGGNEPMVQIQYRPLSQATAPPPPPGATGAPGSPPDPGATGATGPAPPEPDDPDPDEDPDVEDAAATFAVVRGEPELEAA